MARPHDRFAGVYCAMLTPYNKSGNVCKKTIDKLVNWHIEKGLRGFYVCGSTGEHILLTTAERKVIAERTVKAAAGRANVIVHVGTPSSEESAELARHAEKVGADAISSLPPIFFPGTPEAINLHYDTILKKTGLPLLIYNYAVRGEVVPAAQFIPILAKKGVAGMKYTGYNLYEMQGYIEEAPDRFILSGADEMSLPALTMGVIGSIGSTQNVFPEIFVKIYECHREEDLRRAEKLQRKVNQAVRIMKLSKSISGWKLALRARGIDTGGVRPPLTPTDAKTEKKILRELEKIGLL
ncbi:MAG: dihydrodipicolinate synthase family protein [Planctomycetes bacterium]|nr:dihydrodipicolinate synthase family protein [Planctomycetota bacterium]